MDVLKESGRFVMSQLMELNETIDIETDHSMSDGSDSSEEEVSSLSEVDMDGILDIIDEVSGMMSDGEYGNSPVTSPMLSLRDYVSPDAGSSTSFMSMDSADVE